MTNFRDFVLVGKDTSGRPTKLETLRLAQDAETFDRLLERPGTLAHQVGQSLGEYLRRALSHHTTLIEPKDLAWLLASYARDALARVEAAGDAPSLLAVRTALEQALGVRFQGDRGRHFFHSTLVQTLFYGIFSAWVLWSRQTPPPTLPQPTAPTDTFDWRTAVWHLRAPVLRALFQQLSDPGRLQPLGLVELLDWTAAALGRVDRPAFFARFSEGEAVPYFYEPFLEAFDPELRKQLGVWYTPTEVVRYLVARVDRALKDDLDIPDGAAACGAPSPLMFGGDSTRVFLHSDHPTLSPVGRGRASGLAGDGSIANLRGIGRGGYHGAGSGARPDGKSRRRTRGSP